MYFIYFTGSQQWETLDYFVKASLQCNFNKPVESPKLLFYSQFNTTNVRHIESIKKHQDDVIADFYNFIDSNITECKEIINKLDADFYLIFRLFVASKASGIYGCNNNCTYQMIDNKNLLMHNIHLMLLDEKMATMLGNACKLDDTECENAIAEIKFDDFTTKPFEKQASIFAIIIDALAVEMKNAYAILAEEHPTCKIQIERSCKGIKDRMSYLFVNVNFKKKIMFANLV